METESAISVVFISAVAALAFTATVTMTIQNNRPVGWDYRYHVNIAEAYVQGDFHAIATNYGLYPPLFHLMLAGFIVLGILLPASMLLQVFFFPLAVLSVAFLAWKRLGPRQAAMSAAILIGSVAMLDRSQVIPQSLTMIFVPLGLLFFLSRRKWPALGCVAVTLYSHGVYGFHLLGAMLLHAWRSRDRDYRKMAGCGIALLIPIIILLALSLPQAASFASSVTNPQEQAMLADPIKFVLYMGVVPFIMLPVSLALTAWKRRLAGQEIVMISLYWLFLLTPLLGVELDRFASFAVQPVAILAAASLGMALRDKKRFWTALIIIFIVSFATAYIPMLRIFSGYGGMRLDV